MSDWTICITSMPTEEALDIAARIAASSSAVRVSASPSRDARAMERVDAIARALGRLRREGALGPLRAQEAPKLAHGVRDNVRIKKPRVAVMWAVKRGRRGGKHGGRRRRAAASA